MSSEPKRPQESSAGTYSAQPRKRRGNRRASNNSPFTDQLEPKIGSILKTPQDNSMSSEDEMGRWLREERPPHWG